MQKQLIIFDLDGTLADTRLDLATGINLTRAHYGLPPLDLDTVTGFVGNGIRKLVERSLEGSGVDIDEAVELDRRFYGEHMLDQTALYPDVEDGLKKLTAAGHELAVLSNKPGGPTREILKHLGVEHLFFRALGGGDLPKLKPAPDAIEALMNEAGIERERCWMVGDHHTDLEAAHNAGVKSIFVTYGIGVPGGFDPDQTFAGFSQLTDYFTTA